MKQFNSDHRNKSYGATPTALLPRRILRLPMVIQLCGVKRSTIYHWMSKGLFPRSMNIGSRAVGWDSQDIDDWIAAQLEGRVWTTEGES